MIQEKRFTTAGTATRRETDAFAFRRAAVCAVVKMGFAI
jgi:hypothetical protein